MEAKAYRAASVKKPTHPGSVPPGGYWRFKDPDTGEEIAHPYFVQVKARAHAARVKAGLPIPYNFDEWFDDLVCQSTPQGCYEVPEVPPEPAESSLFRLSLQFATSMVQWAKAGMPVVPWEEFKRRLEICQGSPTQPRCNQYHPGSTFGLARCTKCGCTKLKLFIGTERCPLNKW